MTGIQSSLYTAAIALCVFSAGLLRDQRSRDGRPFAWLTIFLAIATLGFGLELLMIHPATPLKALWLGLRMATSLLIAPCLWLVVRQSVEGTQQPGFPALSRGQRAAILTGFALLLPLMASAHLGLGYYSPLQPTSPLHSRVIHGTMLGCIAIFAVQVPYYLWLSRRLLLRAAGTSKWLQFPLLVVLTTWLLGLFRTLQCIAHGPRELDLVFALADVSVTVGAIYMLVRRIPVVELSEPAVAPEPAALPEAKYARSKLDAVLRVRIQRKLEGALTGQELYRDSLLNLRSLSRGIGEKAHYVSQVINQDLDSNFYELVNRHRIEAAKTLLAVSPDQTVLEIALTVGFNSKSTFNTAFRQNTGMTPSEYRAEVSGKK